MVFASITKMPSSLSRIAHAIPLNHLNTTPISKHTMRNPNALYEDMEKLNALYEELCWAHDDELVFTHENGRVVIYNNTQEKQQ
ncbi:DUF7191 family protein [Acinetobacter baumannii]|uniref:DUF7191 family protein n=1 Tax=Acinetobacter baumannii TaxID=470 RepID=UPI003CC79DE5